MAFGIIIPFATLTQPAYIKNYDTKKTSEPKKLFHSVKFGCRKTLNHLSIVGFISWVLSRKYLSSSTKAEREACRPIPLPSPLSAQARFCSDQSLHIFRHRPS